MEVSGFGSIQQLDKSKPKSRCRKWKLYVMTTEGRKSKRFTGTYSQAKKELDLFITNLEEDKLPKKITFIEYSNKWYMYRKLSNNYSSNTLKTDKKLLKRINDSIGNYNINAITTLMLKEFIFTMTSKQDPTKQVSNTYKSKYYDILNLIFIDALANCYITKNPMDKINKPSKDTQERKILNRKEFNNLIEILNKEPKSGYIMAIYLIMYLGLRRSEAVACTWDDLNINEKTLFINKAFKEADNSIGKPKSEAGERTLPLSDLLMKNILEWKNILTRNTNGKLPQYICCNNQGNLLNTKCLYKWWLRFLSRNNYPKITLHELRHTTLTILGRHASSFDLKDFAGWSSLSPAKRYVHKDQTMLRRALAEAEL